MSTAAHGQPKPTVTVINPVTSPVNARITNTVVPVEVSNADPIPVSVPDSEATRQIFERAVNISLSGEISDCNSADTVAIPEGKRLVIEYLSASGQVAAPAEIVRVMLRHPSFPDFLLNLPAGKTAPGDGVNYSAAGQYVHVYSDENLWACAAASDQTSGAVQVNIVGYLLNLP